MYVFVYGTLKRGYSNHYVMINANAKYIGDAKVRYKEMYYAFEGGFPAVIDGNGVVYGEIYKLPANDIYLKFEKRYVKPVYIIDRLEGYHRDNINQSMYIRKKAKAILLNNKEVWVQIYIWNGYIHKKLKIESGIYRR